MSNSDSMPNEQNEKTNDVTNEVAKLADSLKSDLPYFKVELSKLAPALKVAAMITDGNYGKNAVAEAVGLRADAKTRMLKIYSTNFTVFFSYNIPLFRMCEDDNICEDFFAVSYPVLRRLISVCNGVICVYKKDGEFYFKCKEGYIEIETIAIAEDCMLNKEKPAETYTNLDADILKNALSKLYPYVSLEVNRSHRRVYVIDNVFYAQYMFSCARIKSPQQIPNMDLPIKEMKILYTIMNATDDKHLTIKSTKKRIFFEGEHFVVSTLIAGERMTKEFFDNMDAQIFNPEYNSAIVQTYRFSRLVELSKELPYSISRMQFNYNDKKEVIATMLTKLSNSTFCIGSASDESSVEALETPVEVQTDLLHGMMKLYKGSENIDFYITPKGIGIKQALGGSAIINIESAVFTEAMLQEINQKGKS